MTNYFDKEQICKHEFDRLLYEFSAAWHICTPGDLTFSLNTTEEDYRFSVSNIAISAAEVGLLVITDQVMSNHLHVIGAGKRERCLDFIDVYRYRQVKYLKDKGLYYKLSDFDCREPIGIETLMSMRREIIYCNRNGYLVNPYVTPFSYPWGGGSLYFNPYAQTVVGIPATKIAYRHKRELTYRSAFEFPRHYTFKDGMILPSSYVDYRRGQSFFRDAHHYFSMLSKDYETFSEEALRYGDKVVVTDEEMYSVVMMMVKRDYAGTHPTLLPPSVKVDMARILHKQYRASAQQIRRLLKLDQSAVEQIIGL